ncbi:hypothetical protein PybrP1_008153 [[Pythium] brassicae (nom. inval.)]|nr:hypothetical protein PybrP1_008153 [[Pythium] brassicae (nom. inval.)]
MWVRKRLWVEVVGARNLESSHALDAYCVLQVVPALDVDANADANVLVQLFNEKNFFFDMFPASSDSLSSRKQSVDDSSSCESRAGSTGSEDELETEAPVAIDSTLALETDSEDDEDGRECDRDPAQKVYCALQIAQSATPPATPPAAAPVEQDVDTTDEPLGFLELNVARYCKPTRTATDAWYRLRGTRSGEVRVRTLCLDSRLDGKAAQLTETAPTEPSSAAAAREALFRSHLYDVAMRDHYGFAIPESAQAEWAHLRSYEDCREQRRMSDWEQAFGAEFFFLPSSASMPASPMVRQLARAGVPRSWRERVYMTVSGAREKQQSAGVDYYASLVEQSEAADTLAFRQIELDIGRTFGHSGTKICTVAGRAALRRVLRAYSLRNPSIGYCQGLNFIVGFLTLAVEEEAAFWLLAVVCEDLFPGYYTPTMAETQTDMLVLKELIADELPELDAFTAEVGLPLELLGSQWLLCLFTTTFPSETVFRIFDCVFTEGSAVVFPVIIAHLRRLERSLVRLGDFQAVLSALKDAENVLLDADSFLLDAGLEADRIDARRVEALRDKHRESVRDEMQRAARARALNRQLAVVYQIPAFSSYAASLLRFFHEEAEVSSRSDVAFVLTLLCHGLVWLAEHSQRLQR